jgi:hypothetical protein
MINLDKFKIKRFQDLKTRFLKDLKYDKNINSAKIGIILKDALYYQLVPDAIKDYIKLFEDKKETLSKGHIRSIKKIIDELTSYSQYRFLMIGGAMMEHKTIYEKSHLEAWQTISEEIAERSGYILTALCYEMDGKSTRAFENIEAMFKDPTDGVRGAVVKDFLPEYKYKIILNNEK